MKYFYALRLAACLIFLTAFMTACGGAPKGVAVLPKDGVFSFDARKIGAGDVHFYRYDAGRKSVTFFIARAPSGEIRTAFDACVTCYPYRMGYKVGNNCVICVYCNTAFRLDELGTGKGNCIPIAVPHRLEGDTLTISLKDIEAGEKWF